MLDQQRRRSSNENRENASLVRIVLISHLFAGVAACGSLVFHEQFSAAVGAGIWYVLSVFMILGMCNLKQWCRVLLGLWFCMGAIGALIYLAWLPPQEKVEPSVGPPLALQVLPFWLSALAMLYLAGGMMLFISRRINTATARGFVLWDIPHNW